jgi:hypothetical protein
MRNHVRSRLGRLVVAVSLATLLGSCGKPPSSNSSGESEGREGTGGAGASESSSESDSSGQKPLSLDEARFQKYVVYRKELHARMGSWTSEVIQFGKKIESGKTDIGKAVTAVSGAQKIAERRDTEMKALLAKHGFTEEEDQRLWDAVGNVLAARFRDNPAFAESMKGFEAARARGGEEKANVDALLKELEANETKELAEAREKYGPQCVDTLSRHVKELQNLQMDAIQTISESGKAAK